MTPSDVNIVAGNIEDFIEVPDGIERLRKAVLTLAVSGKLILQDAKEGNAEDLYRKIQSELEKESGASKKAGLGKKRFELIASNEVPFNIPKSWRWVHLGKICSKIGSGSTPKGSNYSKEGIPFFRSQNIQNSGLDYDDIKYVSGEVHKKMSGTCVYHNDILLNITGGSIGRCAITPNEFKQGNVSQHVCIIRPVLVDNLFLHQVILSPFFQNYIFSFTTGAGRQGLPKYNLEQFLTPLPPLLEQKRIVRKVNELMDKINELEMKKKERDEIRISLSRSAMLSLGKGDSKIAFEQLIELIKTPTDIKELENALLTLAVSGKLVPQDKSEETGKDLFSKIQLKRVKIKKIIETEDKDPLFTIPSSWKWSRLEDIFDVRDGTHDSPKYHEKGYPLVTSKNLYYGNLDFLNVKYVSETDYKKINERSRVDRDDILFAMIGSIGNPVIVNTDIEFSIKNVALFKYYDKNLSEPNFLLIYLKYAAEHMKSVSAGGVQSFVSLGFLRGYPFPLPPLLEQKRIVKKVEEIMVLVDHLKQVINK